MPDQQAPLSRSARRVQDALAAHGFDLRVVELPASTRTAVEAAAAVGVTVGQIAKSLVFKTAGTSQAVLIIASGSNRVNEDRIREVIGEAIQKASADFVLEQTGFVIGGIPPTGHIRSLRTLIDIDLFQYDEIWAAAGTPNAVFRLTPADLERICPTSEIISII